jgi:FdhE protein
MSRAVAGTLARVAQAHPEWEPWLALWQVTNRAADDGAWTRMVPAARGGRPDRDAADRDALDHPLLAGSRIVVDGAVVARFVATLVDVATTGAGARPTGAGARPTGVPARPTGVPARPTGASRVTHLRTDVDLAVTILGAALAHDTDRLDALAPRLDTEPGVLRAVAPFSVMPLLLACATAWRDRVPEWWPHGWCLVCGAWPAFAEARGLDRARRFRCARCGSDWHAEWLVCPFCGTRDHAKLGALVPSAGADTRRVETCSVCRGYVKTITTLQACPAREVPLLDLDTVALDVAAIERGHRRPDGPGHALDIDVAAATPLVRRLLRR